MVWIQFVCVLLASTCYVISGNRKLTWVNVTPLNNKLKQGGYEVQSRSGIECGKKCSSDNTCASFFFASTRVPNCHCHIEVYNDMTVDLVDAPGAKYYVLNKDTTTTTSTTPTTTTTTAPTAITTTTPFTTSTTISSSPCPSDPSGYTTVLLDDGSSYTYGMPVPIPVNSLDPADINNDSEFYVDGSNADAADYLAIDAWKMANGEQVPMTNDFWVPNCPNEADTQHCIRMRKLAGYMWDDTYCENIYYYICEK